jgi:hypothetical protein
MVEKRGDVLGEHLARMGRQATGEIKKAYDRDAMANDSFPGNGEFAVATSLGRQIDDD